MTAPNYGRAADSGLAWRATRWDQLPDNRQAERLARHACKRSYPLLLPKWRTAYALVRRMVELQDERNSWLRMISFSYIRTAYAILYHHLYDMPFHTVLTRDAAWFAIYDLRRSRIAPSGT